MECYCDLRNKQDLRTDGQTPYERRNNSPFDGPTIPFGAEVKFDPNNIIRPDASASVRHKNLLLESSCATP